MNNVSLDFNRNLLYVILLAEKGYLVVATARDISKMHDIPAALKLKMDVTDEESIKIAVETVIRKYGRIDILVNNAGYSVKKKLKARYLIAVPKIYNLLIVLPGGLREKNNAPF